MKILILQPLVPHYREEFFDGLAENFDMQLYCYEKNNIIESNNFHQSSFETKYIRNVKLGPFLFFNPIPFLRKDCNIIILMLHFGHISTWLILLTKFIHRKKIILWGQGISVKRYIKEEKKLSILIRWMISLADTIWLYTKKEQRMWKNEFPNKQIVSLDNTISNVKDIVNFKTEISKSKLKENYSIKTEICLIFCARFNNPYRRTDILEEIIKKSESLKHGFIIIGDGPYKPDFSKYSNVYDFGTLYDVKTKSELFTIADLYIQPGWVGLSIVEAMAYGKPVLTLRRNKEILQCVEYFYLRDKFNAILFSSIDDYFKQIYSIDIGSISEMSVNAKQYVYDNLLMENMIYNATSSIK